MSVTIIRGSSLALQQLTHQALGRLGIAAALHWYLQDEIVLIHSAPVQCFLPRIETTASSRCHLPPSRPTERRRISLAKARLNFSAQPNRLLRDNDPTESQQVLDHSQAEREAGIEPHGVGNDFSGKGMAAI